MSTDELLSYTNITAMVLGYILLAMFLAGAVWMATNWAESWQYKRRRKRKNDIEWDNVRSAWLLDLQNRPADDPTNMFDINDRIKTVEQPLVDPSDRIDTDVMTMTLEQIVNYQKEQNPHDAS